MRWRYEGDVDMSGRESVDLEFPACLAEDFGAELPDAIEAVETILASTSGTDFSALARNSPALGADQWQWQTYLRCSVARMVHVVAALRARGVTGGRVLDFGAYFGNFSLLFARLGFTVDALDAFGAYGPCLDGPIAVLRAAGVRLLDFADVGRELEHLAAAQYDVVLCTGVIEHVPHTPRFLLEALDRVLRVGGELVIDTPNLVHIYNRQKFARGESVHADIRAQYYTERPFEGHHREYTMAELVWMLEQLGHTAQRVEAFNYSMYEQTTLRGRDVVNHWAMVKDPAMREVLMTVSTKPESRPVPPLAPAEWQSVLVDPEAHWQRALPAETIIPAVSPEGEQMLTVLQAEIDRRDTLLGQAQRAHDATEQSLQEEIVKRDRTVAELHSQIGALQRSLDAKLSEVVKRRWRHMTRRSGK
jgi:2-polyprenyl-3-methyl-5-hydroxy-6-metoxy-1,4-benzoquinol methylase